MLQTFLFFYLQRPNFSITRDTFPGRQRNARSYRRGSEEIERNQFYGGGVYAAREH